MQNSLENIYEARIGRIMKVYQISKNDPNDKRIFCDIEIFPAGQANDVPLYGGGIDFTTKFPHGIFCLPRENQMILILFVNANFENPVACIPLPYNYDAEFKDKFYSLLEDIDDINIFHFTGSRIIIRKTGKFEIQKRIEETPGNFVNHSIQLEIKYESSQSKKIFTDLQNNIIITLSKDEVKVIDTKSQSIIITSKDGEEKIVITDKWNNKVEMKDTGVKITDKNSNTIDMVTGEVKINGTNLEVLI